MTSVSACSDEEPVKEDIQSKLLIDEGYFFNFRDTVISADEHTIELYMASTIDERIPVPDDWTARVTCGEQFFRDIPKDEWKADLNPEASGNTRTGCFDSEGRLNGLFNWMNDIRFVKEEGQPNKIIIHLPENAGTYPRSIIIHGGRKSHPNQSIIAVANIIQKTKVDETPFELKIRYQNEVHSSMVHLNQKEEYVYSDPEFERMMNDLTSNPNIEMLVLDDTIIDFFDVDSPESDAIFKKLDVAVADSRLKEINHVGFDSTPLTRANGFEDKPEDCLGYFAVYDYYDFGGKKITKTLDSFYNMHNLQELAGYNINDLISSVALGYYGDDPEVCSVITLWDDADFNNGDKYRKKHRISFVASYYNRQISRPILKNIPCMNTSSSWNDRASSLSFHYGYLDKSLIDY